MGSSSRFWAASGGFLLAVATGLAAWHAHGLAEDLAEEEHVAFGRALLQQFVTGVGLLGLGAWIRLREGDRLLDLAAKGVADAFVAYEGRQLAANSG